MNIEFANRIKEAGTGPLQLKVIQARQEAQPYFDQVGPLLSMGAQLLDRMGWERKSPAGIYLATVTAGNQTDNNDFVLLTRQPTFMDKVGDTLIGGIHTKAVFVAGREKIVPVFGTTSFWRSNYSCILMEIPVVNFRDDNNPWIDFSFPVIASQQQGEILWPYEGEEEIGEGTASVSVKPVWDDLIDEHYDWNRRSLSEDDAKTAQATTEYLNRMLVDDGQHTLPGTLARVKEILLSGDVANFQLVK